MTPDQLNIAAVKYEKLCSLTQGDYRAFLYDCDGTLADNMDAHKATYVAVAASYGIELDDAIIDELAGWPISKVAAAISERYKTKFDPQEFEDLKSKLFFEEYIEKIKPVDFVVEHLIAHAGKVKIGVVSGGTRPAIEKTLQVLGIRQLVEVLVCAGETPHGKPWPDPFLSAAEQLQVPPGKCMVFEDGEPGVKAAIAAGMEWIRIDHI
ncbi:HAD family hydrolase [Deminuibacter soli]|uniref:HAD family phosphatase n=1 Tax=Deminuibacter soli TaxID=2291815 RepID=A0A3E1NNN7_9BACT|nr:HAD family phosphatase [Deminuibacter soli]RFM29530.1 HAD family phosphatase [Deminuibacter soli]